MKKGGHSNIPKKLPSVIPIHRVWHCLTIYQSQEEKHLRKIRINTLTMVKQTTSLVKISHVNIDLALQKPMTLPYLYTATK